MKQLPKISIIVPVYKVEKYISRCIESVKKQTETDWELLLIDDGSPDNSGKICDQYALEDDRIKVFHQLNGGVSSARNKGLDIAQGEWVCFIDSDDSVDATYLEDFRVDEEDCDLVMQGYKRIKDNKILQTKQFQSSSSYKNSVAVVAASERLSIINSPCMKLFKRNIITSHSICFDTNISYGEDHLFSLSFLEFANKVICRTPAGYNYFLQEGESLTTRKVPVEEFLYYIKTSRASHLSLLDKYNYDHEYICAINTILVANVTRLLKSNFNNYKIILPQFKSLIVGQCFIGLDIRSKVLMILLKYFPYFVSSILLGLYFKR